MRYANFPSLELLDAQVRDRILKAINFQEGDRVPIWDLLDNRAIWERFAQPGDSYEVGMARTYQGLGIDLCRGFANSYAESDEGTTRSLGNTETKISGRTCWTTKYPIRSIEDIKNYKVEVQSWESIREQWVPWLRKQQELLAPKTCYVPCTGCGFHATYGLMGLQLFSYAMYECPEELWRIMDAFCENTVRIATVCVEQRLTPIFFVGDDIACKGRLMFSPRYLRSTFIRLLKRIGDVLRPAGIKFFFHSDGNVMPILDDMIEAGIEGLNPIEPIAGMDIGYLKKHYYGRLVLIGNVDCSQVLPLGSVEDVIRATKECIRVASPGGGHLIGSSSEIIASTPVENILAFYRTVHEYGRYPIRL